MFNLDELVRDNIKEMKPYSSARAEYKGKEGIFLDANENPFGTLNRYPDPYQRSLKERLSELKKVPYEQIFIGNGSDEIIDLIIRIFCNPGSDRILAFAPTYGMYEVAAAMNDVKLLEVPLDQDFQINKATLNASLNEADIKVVFICSPNNPTGNCIKDIDLVLQSFKGIVVVDEAYIDFAENESLINKLNDYPNLIVVQTLSKAWGLAAVRIGTAYANEPIIQLLNKVKPPYNCSKLNQDAALETLNNIELFRTNKEILIEQRQWMISQLESFDFVLKIYPSDANFLLIKTKDADKIYNALTMEHIIIRNRSHIVESCLRISIGNELENKKLIKALQELVW
jgi:histidinol-phosphate aminotransferase